MWWQTSNCSPLLICRPREDERLRSTGWLTYSGRLTHISGHPSATGRAQDGERTLARDWRSTAEPRGPTSGAMLLAHPVVQNQATDWMLLACRGAWCEPWRGLLVPPVLSSRTQPCLEPTASRSSAHRSCKWQDLERTVSTCAVGRLHWRAPETN